MRRQQRLIPARAAAREHSIAAASEAKVARWSAWRILTLRRRVEVRTAALGLVAILAIWARPGGSTSDTVDTGQSQEVEIEIQSSDQAVLTGQRKSADAQAAFRQQLTQASAGQWLIYPAAVVVRSRRNAWDDFKVAAER